MGWRITGNNLLLQPLIRYRLVLIELGVHVAVLITPHGVSGLACFGDACVGVVEYEADFHLGVGGADMEMLLAVFRLEAAFLFNDDPFAGFRGYDEIGCVGPHLSGLLIPDLFGFIGKRNARGRETPSDI